MLIEGTQAAYLSLPLRLVYNRMYANHNLHNMLLLWLEERELGWKGDTALTSGKIFVEGMTKAFFQCTPTIWKALNDMHNNGALPI